MPAAAVIPAAAGLGGSIINATMQNKAARQQGQANAAALQFQQEQEKNRQAQWEQMMGTYRDQLDAWNARRNQLAERYGLVSGQPMNAMGGPGGPAGVPPAGGGASLATMMAPQQAGRNPYGL